MTLTTFFQSGEEKLLMQLFKHEFLVFSGDRRQTEARIFLLHRLQD